MRKIRLIYLLLASIILLNACDKEAIDTEKPSIDLSIEGAFPLNCDTLYFGESFVLKMRFADNVELGSNSAFSLDIHNNFDHHTHSTEVTACSLDSVKEAVNPYLYIEIFDLPSGQSEYEIEQSITLPSSDENGLFDEGDYHFFISLSDKEGWSTQKGLSIKILHP